MTGKGQTGTTTTTTKEYSKLIPPLQVKLAWLIFFATEEYLQTGEWPLPPNEYEFRGQAQNQPGWDTTGQVSRTDFDIARKTFQAASTSSPSELLSSQVQAQGEAFPAESLRKLIQKNLPGTPEPIEIGPAKAKATGYRYRASIYWDYACRLLAAYQERTGERIERDIDGCKLTLAAVVAWLRFPLFGGGAGREWMTLGLERLRQETSMKNERLMDCLTQLQEIRLLQTFRAIIPFGGNYPGGSQGYGKGQGLIGRSTPDKEDTGKILVSLEEFMELKAACADLAAEYGGGKEGYWQPRAIQKTNNFYRFKPTALLPEEKAELDVLPVFNPFDLEQLANSASKGKKSVSTQEQAQMQVKVQPGSTLKAQETETGELPLPPAAVEANPGSTQARSNAGSSWEVRGEYVRHIPETEGSTSSGEGTYFPALQKTKEALPVKEMTRERPPNVLPRATCSLKHVHVVVDDVVEEKNLAKSDFQATPETERNTNQGSKGNIATLPNSLGETSLAKAYRELNELEQGKSKLASSGSVTTGREQSLKPYKLAALHSKTLTQPTLYEEKLSRLSPEKLALHNLFLNLVEVLGYEGTNMPSSEALKLAELYELEDALQSVEAVRGKLARGEIHSNPIGLVVTSLKRGYVPGPLKEQELNSLLADQHLRRKAYLGMPQNPSSNTLGDNSGKLPFATSKPSQRTSPKVSVRATRKGSGRKDFSRYQTGPVISGAKGTSGTEDIYNETISGASAISDSDVGADRDRTYPNPVDPRTVNEPYPLPALTANDWEGLVSTFVDRASYNGFGSGANAKELLAGSRLEVERVAILPAPAPASAAGEVLSSQVELRVILGTSWQLASLAQPARRAIMLELKRLAPGCQVSFTSLP